MKQIEEEMLKNMHPVIGKLDKSILMLHLKDGEFINDAEELNALILSCRQMMAPVWPTEITLVEKTGKQKELLHSIVLSRMPNYDLSKIIMNGIVINTDEY